MGMQFIKMISKFRIPIPRQNIFSSRTTSGTICSTNPELPTILPILEQIQADRRPAAQQAAKRRKVGGMAGKWAEGCVWVS